MIDWISDKEYWQPALDQSGNDRTDAWVINATDVIPLTDYPPGTKLFLRAEPLHPGDSRPCSMLTGTGSPRS